MNQQADKFLKILWKIRRWDHEIMCAEVLAGQHPHRKGDPQCQRRHELLVKTRNLFEEEKKEWLTQNGHLLGCTVEEIGMMVTKGFIDMCARALISCERQMLTIDQQSAQRRNEIYYGHEQARNTWAVASRLLSSQEKEDTLREARQTFERE